MTVEDPTEDERRRGEGFFVRVPDDEIESEPAQPGVGDGTTPVIRHAVNEQGHVELHDSPIEIVEASIVGVDHSSWASVALMARATSPTSE